MRYLFLMNRTGTCAWRVTPLQRELESLGHQTVAMNLQGFTEDQFEKILDFADVLTFQMVAARDLVERAKERGIYTIFDCDDYINQVPPNHPSFKITQDKSYQSLFRWMMRNVDQVTLSSPVLFEDYRKFNKNTRLLPNYLPATFWERPFNPNPNPRSVRLGWAGGISHQEDLDFIAPVLERIMAEFPEVRLVYTGGGGWNSGSPTSKFRFGNDQFERIPQSRREFNPGSRIEMWPDRLNSMQLDIAIAPLADNAFSRRKTHIKYFEYAINRWPGVYQDFLYGDVVKHGETGFLASTQAEWYAYLKELLDNPRQRRILGQAAYADVKEHHTFEKNRDAWVSAYLQ